MKKAKKKGWQGSNYKLVSPRVSRFLPFQSWTRFIFIKAGFSPRLSTATNRLRVSYYFTDTFVPHHFVLRLFRGRKLLDNIMEWRKDGGKIARTVIRGWKVSTTPPPSFFGANNSDLVTPAKGREKSVEISGEWRLIICLFFRSNRIIIFLGTLLSNAINYKIIIF